MSKSKFKCNRSGVRTEILKLNAVDDMCYRKASEIARECGEGYVAEPRYYPERTGAAVRTDTVEAYYDNLSNNTLEKALGAAKK